MGKCYINIDLQYHFFRLVAFSRFIEIFQCLNNKYSMKLKAKKNQKMKIMFFLLLYTHYDYQLILSFVIINDCLSPKNFKHDV